MSNDSRINNQRLLWSCFVILVILIMFLLYNDELTTISYITIGDQTWSNTSHAHKNKTNIGFITSLHNTLTNKHITCNPNQYRYMKLLLNELITNNIKQNRTKTTSQHISNHYKQLGSNSRTRLPTKIRIQIINGTIYVSDRLIHDRLDVDIYRPALIIYLHHLMNKYGNQLPNTDLIWYFHDYKSKYPQDYLSLNWKSNNGTPYFWSDINIANNYPLNNMFLFGISRSYLKYRYYVDLKDHKLYSKYINQGKFGWLNDYLVYKNVSENNSDRLYF
eukprot:472800_1